MDNQTHKTDEEKSYESPEIFAFGNLAEMTGHCSSGCGHDSPLVHPDEFEKDGGAELDM